MSCFHMKSAGFYEICRISCEIRWISKDQLPGMVSPMFCLLAPFSFYKSQFFRLVGNVIQQLKGAPLHFENFIVDVSCLQKFDPHIEGKASFRMTGDYFNRSLSGWEPIVESWG